MSSTPSSRYFYECIHVAKPSINCLTTKKLSLPPLDDAVFPDTISIPHPIQEQLFVKCEILSVNQQTQLDMIIGNFADVFILMMKALDYAHV
ncbi:hypothetical protein NPIL_376711 [Nephila pilipes]|uniref:Uncharacterized protein n=1 Tax=Nephila pilipes TaxID=299642 RepID=A0A8X6NCM1_NEPPI|nr:hypothetical protein NPIL_376711 [Nephila pilipes]